MENDVERSSELLTGIRAYGIIRKNGSAILKGHFNYEWPTNEMEAICGRAWDDINKRIGKEKAVKHLSSKNEECHCGIYGVVDIARASGHLQDRIKCSVVGWGAVSLNEYGWRAQYARIEKIWIGPHTCDNCRFSFATNSPSSLISHISFSGDKEGFCQYFMCEECVERDILSSAKQRRRSLYVPIMEVIEELGTRYKSPVEFGKPW